MATATFSALSGCNHMPRALGDPTLVTTRSCRSDTATSNLSTSKIKRGQISAILLPSAAGENFRYHGNQTTFSGSIMDLGQLTTSLVGKANATTLFQPEQNLAAPAFVEEEAVIQPHHADTIKGLVDTIKRSLTCLGKTDGEVSVSAYDTAFVARIPAVDDAKKPQFPKSLRWIVANQPCLMLYAHDVVLCALKEEAVIQPHHADTIKGLVDTIKRSLTCLGKTDGEVSVSAYDTAFVARIPAVDDAKKPQFPKSLRWIVANQHHDGSWGDNMKDWVYDRMNQTLSCVVALRSWNYCDDCVQRGVEYLKLHAHKLEAEEMDRMPIGFELAFTAMLREARSLGLDLPYDLPFFHLLQKKRKKKLERVPLELLHSQPTTMLHNLEGIQSLDIDWCRLLRFQSDDGSICCSPSSTAVVYMHTRDDKCLSFLEKTLAKFDDAVPTVYPLDIFHNIWVVDTLERLGIARYFSDEIEHVLETVYQHWSDEQGICWARVLKDVPDLDDSSMAFRLLRQHGYNVSADAFEAFYKDNAFACFAVGQMVQGVSDMLNLYRASQLTYPGETRLDEALTFSQHFLRDALMRRKGNADKWSLKKDLAGEIEYALRYPEYKNLKRMEIRDYLDKYGPDDAWIGKTIYRLRLVNNPDYLALAKADFNLCQAMHQRELRHILRWISNSGLSDSRSVRERIVMFYVMFSAECWEPELSAVRISAAKCLFIVLALHQFFNNQPSLIDLHQLHNAIMRWDTSLVMNLPGNFQACYILLYNTLHDANVYFPHEDLTGQLMDVWGGLVESFLVEANWRIDKKIPTMDEYWNVATSTIALDGTVLSVMLMSGELNSKEFSVWRNKNCPFLRRASEAIRLAQGLADYKGQHMEDHISMFSCYLNENKSSTMEDAVEHFETMRQQVQKQLSQYRDHETNLSAVCRKVVMSFTKVANFYYDGDYEKECHHGLQRLMVNSVE